MLDSKVPEGDEGEAKEEAQGSTKVGHLQRQAVKTIHTNKQDIATNNKPSVI